MHRLDQFSWHSVHVMTYIISLLIRNSAEIFINFYGGDGKIGYLFSFLEFSSTMIMAIHILIWAIFVYGLGKIVIIKQPTPIMQLMTTILLPIHIWLSSEYIAIQKSNSDSSISLWGIINLIVACIVLVITPRFINWQFNFYQLKVCNSIGFVYDTLLGIDFIVQAVGGCSGVNGSVVIWAVAFVKLLRVVVYFSRINYAQSIMQYSSLLGQMTSAINLISMFLSFYYAIDLTSLIWLNTAFIIYFCYQKPPILTQILQYKYHIAIDSVKQTIIEQINSGQNNFNLLPLQKLREVITIFVGMINHDHFENEPWLRVMFSPKFINDALCLRHLIEYAQTQQGMNHNKRISFDLTQTSINAGNIMTVNITKHHNDNDKGITNINKDNDIQLNQANRRQQWSKLWKMIQGLRQVKQQGYDLIRNYLIYAFPLYDIRSINKMIYLHYLNISISTDDSASHKRSLWDKISQEIAYKYLTERVFQQYRIQIDKENQFQSDKTRKLQHFGQQHAQKLKDYQNCDFFIHKRTSGPKPLQTSKFDLFYRQLLTQALIQDLFTNIFSISRRILQLTNRPQQNSQVLQLLLQKSILRNEIKHKLQGIQSLSKMKSIVYKFLLEYYTNNTPHIAINNLNERHFQDYMLSGEENKLESNRNKQLSVSDPTSDGKMMLFVSGMQTLGRIVNYCGNFKQKMELSNAIGKHQKENLEKLSISDILLPIWTKQHRKASKQAKKYDIPLHSNKKLFIQSVGSKHVMEISFQLHYLVRKTDDLIYSLQISFKQVDKLLVYKGNKMAFESFRRIKEQQNIESGNKIRRRSFVQEKNNLDGFTKSVEKYFGEECTIYVQYSKAGRNSVRPKRSAKKIKKVPTIHEKCLYNNDNKKGQMMHLALPSVQKQVRIAESDDSNPGSLKQKKMNPQSLGSYWYQSMGSYSVNDTSAGSTHSSAESIPNSNDVSLGRYNSMHKASTNNRPQTNQHRQKLLRQIKLKQYGKSNLFHKQKLWIFTLLHWQIPPIILVVSLIVRYYSIHQSTNNTTMYDIKLLLENNFMIAQTQLVNSLMYMNQLAQNYGKLEDSDNVQMARLMIENVRDVMGMIESRQLELYNKLDTGVDMELLGILFDEKQSSTTANTNHNTSFYFTTLEYEIFAKQYLSQVGISQALQSNITLNTINTILNSINKLNNHIYNPINNFLYTFQNRYQNYVAESNNKSSILKQIQLYEHQVYTFSENFLTYFLIVVATVAFIVAIVFVYVYVDLQFSVQKLVLQAITFPKQQFKKINNTLTQANIILENAKQYIPNKILTFYDKFQSNPYAWQPKTKMISRNQTPSSSKFPSHSQLMLTHAGVRSGLYDMKYKVYRSKWEVFKVYIGPILVFCAIVGVCQYLLISFIRSAISETQTFSNFSSGTQELTIITAMSNQISISMGMGIQQLDKSSIQSFFSELSQYESTNKLDAFKKIQLTQTSYIAHTFEPVCDMFASLQKPPQCELTSKQLSFSQCISSNLKLFKLISTYLNPTPQIQPLTIHLHQLHRQLSLINLFTSKMMNLNIQTFQQAISEPILYLQLLIIQMGMIILLFNWYTASRLYGKMKMLYDEMFCSCSVQDMIKMEQYEVFINQSKHQKVAYVSGEYVQ